MYTYLERTIELVGVFETEYNQTYNAHKYQLNQTDLSFAGSDTADGTLQYSRVFLQAAHKSLDLRASGTTMLCLAGNMKVGSIRNRLILFELVAHMFRVLGSAYEYQCYTRICSVYTLRGYMMVYRTMSGLVFGCLPRSLVRWKDWDTMPVLHTLPSSQFWTTQYTRAETMRSPK
jgi:hypothetical protein